MKIIFLIFSIFMFFANTVNADSVPTISDTEKSSAIGTIEDYKGVRDVAISQKGKKVNLAIIVDYSVSKSYAKQLGDNFLRLVKTFSKDKSPSKDIGKGIYDYLVGVYYPNQKNVVMGAKVDFADRITW